LALVPVELDDAWRPAIMDDLLVVLGRGDRFGSIGKRVALADRIDAPAKEKTGPHRDVGILDAASEKAGNADLLIVKLVRRRHQLVEILWIGDTLLGEDLLVP